MSLHAVYANPNPKGNRIDIRWQILSGSGYDGVKVVRKVDSYPEHPDDGFSLSIPVPTTLYSDENLRAEQVYYYRLFPYSGNPPVYQLASVAQVASIATAPNGFAEYMWDRIPAIYHRYDKNEQLRRFIELSGEQLDRLESWTRFSRELTNIEKAPGTFLPLLAQWIAWQTDYKQGFDAQRKELFNAPHLYQAIGLIPTVEATIKRISHWESRSKEFVHNVFSSNKPERLNLWSLLRDVGGNWSPVETLQSLDYAYEGRPCSIIDDQGLRWMFYHTQRKDHWEIWYKTSPDTSLPLSAADELQAGIISSILLDELLVSGLQLSQIAVLNNLGPNRWEITDASERYLVEQGVDQIRVYHLTAAFTDLAASRPFITNSAINKYPAAANQADTLWLFWSQYDKTAMTWQLRYRTRVDAAWSITGPDPEGIDIAMNPFAEAGIYDAGRARRQAFPVVDDSDRLWLFWQEKIDGAWQLRYNRRDAGTWGEPVTLPLAAGEDPRVNDDLMVLILPSAPDPRIVLLWSRQAETTTPGQMRWQVALRVKEDLNLDTANWTDIHVLPKAASSENHHDRGAYAIFNGTDIEIFWSSNREDSGWAIWRSTLTDYSTDTWTSTERITSVTYSQHAPLALLSNQQLWLLYRSNRNVVYNSDVYRATQTDDQRYAGSITLDIRHQQQLLLHKKFEDSLGYTYDTGTNGTRDDSHWIARDTVGAYVETNTLSALQIEQGIERLRPVMNEFIPATDRIVFVPQNTLQMEYVYSYDLPPTESSHYINSSYSDEWDMVNNLNALEPGEDFQIDLEP